MATLYPIELPPGTPRSERDTISAFSRLPDSWRIFHGVAWQQKRGRRQGDGEADVVMLHPDHGLLVLEVKGGDIEVDKGSWYSTDAGGERHGIKNPFVQATGSKHALVGYITSRLPSLGHLSAGHAVVFPHMLGARHLGPAGGEPITIDGRALEQPHTAVESLVEHWALAGSLTRAQVNSITELLAPTTRVRSALRFAVASSEAELLRLTQDQYRVLDRLRRTRRAVIYGAAGTGKTVLAAERARRLAADGFGVLLVCFNEPLGRKLRDAFATFDSVTAGTFHSFAMSQMRQANIEVPEELGAEWWGDEAASVLATALERNGFTADALVIDEGQDFRPSWFVALQLAINEPDSAPFYVFADTQQAIYIDEWEAPLDDAIYELDTNCRNTRPIASVVAGVFGSEVPETLASGAPPEYLTVGDDLGVVPTLRKILQRLLHQDGLSVAQVAVLTARRETATELRGKELAGERLVPLGEHGVQVETIHRFKGLEAEVAIVILPGRLNERDRALAYVGMSRARSHLIVIGTEDARQFINWGGEGTV